VNRIPSTIFWAGHGSNSCTASLETGPTRLSAAATPSLSPKPTPQTPSATRAADRAAERALALAEPDRLVLPFAMTGSRELLQALPRHQTAHAALLTEILDIIDGSPAAASDRSPSPPAEELSPGELKVLRYLPTNLARVEIASELSLSRNTVSTHIRSIYAKLGVSDRSSAVRRARSLGLLSAGRTR
jgi:LuxR family transcriptional regulator, maltose regulon positive regulatory protein